MKMKFFRWSYVKILDFIVFFPLAMAPDSPDLHKIQSHFFVKARLDFLAGGSF
jgi:hypothetical protein